MVLTDDTFDEALKKYDNLMVLFYAPWCGHCKKFHPEYAKAAVTLKKENLILAKLDATVNKKMAEKYKIQGFPTTKLFIKGDAIEYNGGRTEKDVVNWMRKKTGPPTMKLNTVEDVEKFIQENEVALVYFGKDSKDIEEYSKVARYDEEHVFGTADSSDILSKYNVKEGTVVFKI
jgi:protein disulfide-isomerase A1